MYRSPTSKSLRILEVCLLFCWECIAERSFLMALASSCSLPMEDPTWRWFSSGSALFDTQRALIPKKGICHCQLRLL